MQLLKHRLQMLSGITLLLLISACAGQQRANDPLPSWNEGVSKQRIIQFVSEVADQQHSNFVPVGQRIATFDNDGTLWSEKPTYFQLFFAMDRIKALAPQHPDWKTTQPYQAVLENDMAALKASGEHGLVQIMMATHSGMTTDEFKVIVTDWLNTAKHPSTNRPFNSMVFQPMLELMDYLRANHFKVFIVSGGGLEFMRPWTEAVYGIPPDQVVGSSVETRYVVRDGTPVIERLPEMHFIDDKDTKPLAISRFIGQRPIFAAGNSDGDYQMLEWTTSGDGPRFGLMVHHTDAEREWAYDRNSSEGRLDRGLDEADNNGWLIVDMANDWQVIYP